MFISFDPSEWISCSHSFPQTGPPKFIQNEIKHLQSMPSWIHVSIPSRDLSVDTLLNLPINLAFDDDFLSCPIPSLTLSSELQQLFGQAWFNGCHSIIHTVFPTTPLPFWVLPFWYSMAQVMNAQSTWWAARDWVEKRQESADDDGFMVVMEILDVLGHLPWDVSLKGFGAEASLRSSELTSLLANSKINGHLIDALIALAIEPLALSTALQCDASRWKEYVMHNTFKCLHYIGDYLCDGTLQCIIFPINITNLHWAVFETCPSADIDAIHCWLKQHNFKPFRKALISQTPLFSDDTKDILCMEEFLVLAYSHLKKSKLLGKTNNDSSSDMDLDIEIMDANAPVVIVTPEPSDSNSSTSTMEAKMSTTKAKVHLDLRTSDEDANGGLFNFFQKIPHKQYLLEVNIPFTWEIEQHEHDAHFLCVKEIKHVEHKCQNATEQKRKQ
ncbi:hypothetical protein DFH29DRAFT_1005851 [Suillus ampliporus]|nr:hypothetical protein DFH29DRAFT_1005851 [Suillus ampliporus]